MKDTLLDTKNPLELPEINPDICTFDEQSFLLNGKRHFILSGEMHYFRIDATLWHKHLQQIKQAGLNTVSTYIPWSLHEQVEGKPDFRGGYAPNLNLEKFIKLCREMELNLIVKPGPYILAELAMHGIPRWFFENYPDAVACDSNGNPYPAKYTYLKHPDYKQKAMLWYDAVMPLIAAAQTCNGGPIILMQVCNEVGVFQWLTAAGDYNPVSLRDYQNYLKSIYMSLDQLNNRYETHFSDWSQIRPPSEQVKNKADHFGYQDWENYHRTFYADYIGWLIEEIRGRGVTIPLFHNVPGWAFSRAKNMPVCLSMYHKLARSYPEVFLGVDHIPENPSYRNFHDDRLINDFTKALQGGKGPLYVAELQAGTREANVKVYPAEMELFYKACLANGIVAMNYYMFSQGQNPAGWGIYDSLFYQQTPLDTQGQPGDCYPVIQKISKLIKTHGENLCESRNNASQALVYYPPYYYREFIYPLFTGQNKDDRSFIKCRLDPCMVTDELLFDSLGKLLAMDNQEYDAIDITNATPIQLDRYKQLWMASTEQLDANSQKTLLDYVRRGGHLICFPTIPKLDLNAKPCNLLAEGLGIYTDRILQDCDTMIRWSKTNDETYAFNYIETFKDNIKSEVIARTCDGKICGLKVNCGKGTAVILGAGFIYQSASHEKAWQKLGLNRDFRGAVICDNPLIITRTRRYNDGLYLFMLNYHNQPMRGKIKYNGLEIPADSGSIYMPPLSALMLPFNLPLTDHCNLAASTSEILNIQTDNEKIILEVSGSENTPGCTILNIDKTIKKVLFNDKPASFEPFSRKTKICYAHSGNISDNLTIHIS